jgi:hypothetical protein
MVKRSGIYNTYRQLLSFYLLLPLPNSEPSTPLMICLPTWLPIAWAALFASAPKSTSDWLRLCLSPFCSRGGLSLYLFLRRHFCLKKLIS